MLGIFILFERNTVLDSGKNVLMPVEPKLLVMCERIGEALGIMYVCTLSNTNRFGAKEYAAYHGMALVPSSAN